MSRAYADTARRVQQEIDEMCTADDVAVAVEEHVAGG